MECVTCVSVWFGAGCVGGKCSVVVVYPHLHACLEVSFHTLK